MSVASVNPMVRKAVEVVTAYQASHGCPPSIERVGELIGRNRSTTWVYLRQAVAMGLLHEHTRGRGHIYIVPLRDEPCSECGRR